MIMAPKRVRWSQKSMRAAIYAVISNNLPINAAADTYDIPRRTLRDHVKRYKTKNPSQKPTSDTEDIDLRVNQQEVLDDTNNNLTEASAEMNEHNEQSWFCHACRVDKVADMRQCVKCSKWYHEVCVGLTLDDTDPFECPIGC